MRENDASSQSLVTCHEEREGTKALTLKNTQKPYGMVETLDIQKKLMKMSKKLYFGGPVLNQLKDQKFFNQYGLFGIF